MRHLPSLFVLSGLMGVALAPSVYAQAVGSIVGTVSDPGNAVVPGATVTAADKNTGFTRTTTSGSDGIYSLPRLPVGTYDNTRNIVRPAI